jgi:hypothetical protein
MRISTKDPFIFVFAFTTRREWFGAPVLLLLLYCISTASMAQMGAIDALGLELEVATPEQIGLHLPVARMLSMDSKVSVQYKKSTEHVWRTAHPLLRIHPEWNDTSAPKSPVDAFAGSIFDLTPGTRYDIAITLHEPGEPDKTHVVSSTTRGLPADSHKVATSKASPSSNLQALFDALVPGDVLELSAGTYHVDGLYVDRAGTPLAPICIRGASRKAVILYDVNDKILELRNASHLIIENLTLKGSGTDSGTKASSIGISFSNGTLQKDVTIRNLDISGVDKGIIASGPTQSLLIYHLDMKGNNLWNRAFTGSNLTWNDDGIRIPGEGNVAFENTLHGFGDSFAVNDRTHSSGVYFYRNRITMTGDDAFEADYATRNIGFYDNYITNSATFVSLDPLWGGPLFVFRNISINTIRGPFKLNDVNSGFLIYNNTIVRTDGSTGAGWIQFNNGSLRNWSFRNNILIYTGSSANLLAVESTGNDPIDFNYNAWFPDGAVKWTNSGTSYKSMSAAIAGAGQTVTSPVFGNDSVRHKHDVVTERNPFASATTLGSDHLTEFTASPVPKLLKRSSTKNAGVPIPNITDGFKGIAPDMGAVIEGRKAPRWGDQ